MDVLQRVPNWQLARGSTSPLSETGNDVSLYASLAACASTKRVWDGPTGHGMERFHGNAARRHATSDKAIDATGGRR